MEVYLKDRVIEIDEHRLVKVQAVWRGAVVRKKMRSLRHTFEDICHDIEDDASIDSSGFLTHIYLEHSAFCRVPQIIKETPVASETESRDNNHPSEKESQNENVSEHSETAPEHNVKTPDIAVSDVTPDIAVSDVTPDIAVSDVDKTLSPQAEPSRITNETSVWDTVDVTRDQSNATQGAGVEEQKQQIVMELLWVQQAINSRKQYLRLKSEMG